MCNYIVLPYLLTESVVILFKHDATNVTDFHTLVNGGGGYVKHVHTCSYMYELLCALPLWHCDPFCHVLATGSSKGITLFKTKKINNKNNKIPQQTNKHPNKQTNKHPNKQTNKHPNKQTNNQSSYMALLIYRVSEIMQLYTMYLEVL